MSYVEKIKSRKYLFAGILFLAIAVVSAIVISSVIAYAEEDYWDLKIGDKTIAVLTTESQANAVIKEVKENYVKEGATVEAITCDPEMSVVQTGYKKDEKPELSSVKEVVENILTGAEEPVVYKVKKGDSLWSIAYGNGFTLDELKAMNKGVNLSMIHPGTTLNLYEMKPFVTVKTTQTATSEKKVKYRTIYRESSDLPEGTTKVKREGKYGKRTVTEKLTMVNDKIVKSVELKSKRTKKPIARIVIKGTGQVVTPTSSDDSSSGGSSTKSSGSTYSGNASGIAGYALQFVGNPYVYGGSSLTNGADCSGFVMAVFQKFGVSLPHNASTIGGYGRSVSLSEAQPGDVVCYGWHVGIYIGGGQIVHAVNEGMGIAVTSTSYIGPVIDVRRIIE